MRELEQLPTASLLLGSWATWELLYTLLPSLSHLLSLLLPLSRSRDGTESLRPQAEWGSYFKRAFESSLVDHAYNPTFGKQRQKLHSKTRPPLKKV
jgi:hypothetical protein